MKTTAALKFLLVSLLAVGAASAAPITGSIKIASYNDSVFNVNYVTNTVTFGGGADPLAINATVTNASGSYLGLLDAKVHYNSFVYSPFTGPVNPLWKTLTGAPAASFSLTSITFIDEIVGSSLTLKGLGIASVGGASETVGSWAFTASQNGVEFNWDSINSPAPRVPDGGATLALLGVSILGLGGMRRLLPSLKK